MMVARKYKPPKPGRKKILGLAVDPQPAKKGGWWEIGHTLKSLSGAAFVLLMAGGAKVLFFASGILDTFSTNEHTTTIVGQDGAFASFALMVLGIWRFYKKVTADNTKA